MSRLNETAADQYRSGCQKHHYSVTSWNSNDRLIVKSHKKHCQMKADVWNTNPPTTDPATLANVATLSTRSQPKRLAGAALQSDCTRKPSCIALFWLCHLLSSYQRSRKCPRTTHRFSIHFLLLTRPPDNYNRRVELKVAPVGRTCHFFTWFVGSRNNWQYFSNPTREKLRAQLCLMS